MLGMYPVSLSLSPTHCPPSEMVSPAPNLDPPTSTLQPDPTMDADLDPEIDMTLDDPAPPDPSTLSASIPEPREATKKDISLRDFMSKMDDYAPIVRTSPPLPPLSLPLPLALRQSIHSRSPCSCLQIPDAVTSHHLLLAGLSPSTPLPLSRLLALATQKFIADIAADAYQYSRMRSSTATAVGTAAPTTTMPAPTEKATGGGGGEKGKHVLGVQRAGYGGGGGGGGAGRAVLTMEDLGCAVGEYGVNVKRGEFYR